MSLTGQFLSDSNLQDNKRDSWIEAAIFRKNWYSWKFLGELGSSEYVVTSQAQGQKPNHLRLTAVV